MSGLGMSLLNRGRTLTTFYPRGTSVVDTSWANFPAFSRVHDWMVLVNVEPSSDHRPILFRVGIGGHLSSALEPWGVFPDGP